MAHLACHKVDNDGWHMARVVRAKTYSAQSYMFQWILGKRQMTQDIRLRLGRPHRDKHGLRVLILGLPKRRYCKKSTTLNGGRFAPIASALIQVAGVVLGVTASKVHAERIHQVASGQTPAQIASKYRVSVQNLLAANSMSQGDFIRPGQSLRVPEQGVVFVKAGDSLSALAKSHGVSVSSLMKANRLSDGEVIQVGQKLLLPGYQAAHLQRKAAKRWGEPRNPGVAKFARVYPQQKRTIRLVDKRGRTRMAARRALRALFRDNASGKTMLPNARLVQLLARVSDHFGGRPIHIVSGYRTRGGYTSEGSRHTSGRAVDFRIPGVPNRELRDFCRTLPGVGVGFYPNSTFVHLDVRDDGAFWVDVSRPGQKPTYVKAAEYKKRNHTKESDDSEAEGRANAANNAAASAAADEEALSEAEHLDKDEASAPQSSKAASDTAPGKARGDSQRRKPSDSNQPDSPSPAKSPTKTKDTLDTPLNSPAARESDIDATAVHKGANQRGAT